MENIEAVVGEIDLNIAGRSHRDVIIDFIAMEGVKVGRLQFDFPAEAKYYSRGLRMWIKKDEKINILQRGYDVYLVKVDE